MGFDPKSTLVMKRHDSDVISLKGILGEVAEISVHEGKQGARFGLYRPFDPSLRSDGLGKEKSKAPRLRQWLPATSKACVQNFQEETIMKRWINTVVLAVDFALDWIAYVIERQADKMLIRRLRSEARAEVEGQPPAGFTRHSTIAISNTGKFEAPSWLHSPA
jgi:hypothetical protein